MAQLSEMEVFAKTLYAEARGEPDSGIKKVAEVIQTRAYHNKSYWGGNTIKGVCLKSGQFSCWNGKTDIEINEPQAYTKCQRIADEVYQSTVKPDGPDHYHNPSVRGEMEQSAGWRANCNFVETIGKHDFYKSKNL